ncbi:hypothetical protein CGI03_22810 [Vibrio parahaemolyticus]|uniref:hypothetical protein n=3 Tax=Vibrio parahaemolyticus TaxID=670 RepID=UPI00111D9CF0|nr:hypothetical protein [Vibrio parahaemolyticus]EIO4087880.1 hypothetical protein [Vibrio parahaemolyticus]TOL13591.1 hypothetical protein CGI03_22810 [Vibrio parahaemolyticus]TOL54680.1 hypothetical protein CGH95_23130 [Vibrio parahaemolyticus]HCE4735363.1 hypothetical protein [Vibrio parahaemolyticus]HCG9872019.1 hypothetical protein [Vibrio parahaemolyticus]
MTPDIFSLFEADSKKEIKQICSKLTVTSKDFEYLVSLSEANVIEFPYLHACKFIEEVPENVHLSAKNLHAIQSNGIGPLSTDAQKAIKKLFQAPLQVKRTKAHLFYRHDHRYWHLFFFDLNDRAVVDNHWDCGSHIHYISWLWPNLQCQSLWRAFCNNGKKAVGGHEHIRFKK